MVRLSNIFLALFACFSCGCATGEVAPSMRMNRDSGPLPDVIEEQIADTGVQPEGAAGGQPDAKPDAPIDVEQPDQEVPEAAPPDAEPPPDGPTCDATVVINEIQTEGASEPDDEFVELYNAGACAVPMDEFSLYYRAATGTTDITLWTAIAGQSLKPGQFFVLGGSKYSHGAPDFAFSGQAALSAAGGGLALKKGSKTIDMVGWGTAKNAYVDGSPSAAPAAGKSVGRHPDGADTDSNVADFKSGTPTPRKANN